MRRIDLIIHTIIISIFSNQKCYGEPTYNGTIAGNLSISQCLNGNRPENFIWEQYVTTVVCNFLFDEEIRKFFDILKHSFLDSYEFIMNFFSRNSLGKRVIRLKNT